MWETSWVKFIVHLVYAKNNSTHLTSLPLNEIVFQIQMTSASVLSIVQPYLFFYNKIYSSPYFGSSFGARSRDCCWFSARMQSMIFFIRECEPHGLHGLMLILRIKFRWTLFHAIQYRGRERCKVSSFCDVFFYTNGNERDNAITACRRQHSSTRLKANIFNGLIIPHIICNVFYLKNTRRANWCLRRCRLLMMRINNYK